MNLRTPERQSTHLIPIALRQAGGTRSAGSRLPPAARWRGKNEVCERSLVSHSHSYPYASLLFALGPFGGGSEA